MAKKRKLRGCPMCGSQAFWTKGNKDIRMIDTVRCLECGLTLEEDYKPFSALDKWNCRVLDHTTEDKEVNLDGDNL